MKFDDKLLETAVGRKPVLVALLEGPHHRRELQEQLDLSKSTCHRIIRSFDENGLVQRTSSGYGLTLLGRIVAEQVKQFEEGLKTACQLQPLLELFESSADEFDYVVSTDADVDWVVERDPPLTIDRDVEFVERSDVIRVIDWTPVPELYIEKIFQIIGEDGMRAESIYPKDEVEHRLEKFPESHDQLIEREAKPRYWVYDDVPPWGMTIYDDSLVQLRAYEQQSGAHLLDATTDDPRVAEWAMDIFADYRERADPLSDVDDLPDWGDYSW